MRILSFDPGGTTGIALIDTDSEPMLLQVWEIKTDKALGKFLRDEIEPRDNIDLFLIEQYTNRGADKGGFDHNGDKGDTHKTIGVIKSSAEYKDVKIAYCQPSDKPVNYGWVGMKYVKGKKGMHIWDAVTHAYGYCIRKNLGVDKKARLAFAGSKT